MPSLSTLIDTFNDNVIGPNWGDSYEGVTETGGRARVPCTAGTYAGYQTGRAWTLAGASIYLKLVTKPAASTGTDVSCNFNITSSVDGTSIGFKYNAVTAKLRLQSNVDYFDAAAIELTYDATNHLWLRIREDGTNVYWDTSANGSTWTNRRTLATPAWVTTSIDNCAVDLYCYRDSGTADYAEYDNVNTTSDGAVHTGTGTGSAASAAAGTGKRTAGGTGTGTAQADASATGITIHRGAASATIRSLATVTSASDEIPEVAGMAAGDWDLVIEQGATFVQTYTVVDDPDFSWAGWNARAQIRTSANSAAQLLLNLTPYLTVVGGAVRLAIPAAVTETLTREGRWDLEMVMGATVVRILQGKAVISLEVTR
ncbi:hypothetical protein AB0I93_26810 [Streptomyces sp. NPDC049967]|uniref:hypothetical protein n=1 Tax=Streptomyces sp. NPDC049967 TaxID=3155658 RepID=UPI0034493609